ncbi:hypothetical protein UCDDA912_g06890 [Diaporthe ampelina]|uniref:2EXR domain-containing protein n=1 Tax=Diaporthe ampelina TaxID=1214573 RepID=A0A0G2FG90_9PEZI|nr:hypothetical protein UCDDA912_g06890 [Diaporthe ampelina]
MSDESDSEGHYYSASEEGDESHESDSDGANHGLLDLEALEASSEPEFDPDRFSDDGSYAEYHFPKFMQLPPEIREMVWAAFCPDLGSEPRVFELHLHTIISPPGAVHLPMVVRGIVAGPQLESQTAPMRAVLAVHRESRALALKSAPHELSLSNGELVRYHEERDVLFVALQEDILLRGIALRFQELGIEAQSLAFPTNLAISYADDVVDLMYLLPQMRRIFILNEEDDLDDLGVHFRDYAWVATKMVHRYRLDTEEEGEAGLVSPVGRIFCWPDLDNHHKFAEDSVEASDESPWWKMSIAQCRDVLGDPLEWSRELNDDELPDEEKTEAIDRLQNIEVWPMIRFNFSEGLDRFHNIETRGRSLPEQLSQSEGSYDDTEDEYESEGIDDDPIDDSTSVDDDDDLLAQDPAQQFFHPHASSYQLLDNSSGVDELPPANFSSDEDNEEHDHVTPRSDSENESGSQTRAARPKRRVVESDSIKSATETEQSPRPPKRHSRAALPDPEDYDDEGSSGVEPVRGANRRARAIPIDSEDDDEQDDDDVPQPSRAGRRRGRAAPIDSDDDDGDDDEEEGQQPSKGRRSRGRVVQEESDEDEDGESDSQGGGAKTKDFGSSDEEGQSSSDDEEDDPLPPERMSLARRLRMESRQARPRQLHDDGDSEADGANGDGYGYSDDQEDEVDESDSGMVMGMAEEYEGENDESEEDY